MTKHLVYVVGIVLIIIAGLAGILAFRSSDQHKSDITTSALVTEASKKACDIFTLEDAKKILGENVKGGVNPITEPTDDFDVSACNYTQDSGAVSPVSSRNSATLLVQAPTTKSGIESNQKQFLVLVPADSTRVSGYGQQAYWDSKLGQLNILKNNNWYIISVGPSTPSARTLGDTKHLADILIDKI